MPGPGRRVGSVLPGRMRACATAGPSRPRMLTVDTYGVYIGNMKADEPLEEPWTAS